MQKMAMKKCTDNKNLSDAYTIGLKDVSYVGAMNLYGARGIVEGSPNCLASSAVSPLVMSVSSIAVGLRSLSFAVRMIVINIETFFLPFSERVPKVSFRNKTQFLRPVSAMLFVGLISSGKLRNVKISFLCFLSLFRKVSHPLWDRGVLYNFLNDLRICFFRPLQISGCKVENCA